MSVNLDEPGLGRLRLASLWVKQLIIVPHMSSSPIYKTKCDPYFFSFFLLSVCNRCFEALYENGAWPMCTLCTVMTAQFTTPMHKPDMESQHYHTNYPIHHAMCKAKSCVANAMCQLVTMFSCMCIHNIWHSQPPSAYTMPIPCHSNASSKHEPIIWGMGWYGVICYILYVTAVTTNPYRCDH